LGKTDPVKKHRREYYLPVLKGLNGRWCPGVAFIVTITTQGRHQDFERGSFSQKYWIFTVNFKIFICSGFKDFRQDLPGDGHELTCISILAAALGNSANENSKIPAIRTKMAAAILAASRNRTVFLASRLTAVRS
jgi:hypothetical protein